MDIDFDQHTITFSTSAADLSAKNGEVIIKDTKTHAVRRVSVDESTMRYLIGYREAEAQRRVVLGTFVFSKDPEGLSPWRPNHHPR